MDYKKIVFSFVKPPSKLVSFKQIKNRTEHEEILLEAKNRGLLLYYALADNRDGKCFAKQPWQLDTESVVEQALPSVVSSSIDKPHVPDKLPLDVSDGLVCPICDKKMNSTQGRTLHVKSKHPEKFDEYLKATR